jgi:uncharacterized membrane protein
MYSDIELIKNLVYFGVKIDKELLDYVEKNVKPFEEVYNLLNKTLSLLDPMLRNPNPGIYEAIENAKYRFSENDREVLKYIREKYNTK